MFEKLKTPLEGVWVLKPKVFADPRGYFYELYQESKFKKIGIETHFVQDNCSRSSRGVIRGLHFQYPNPQAKLIHCLEGEIRDVAVDIRQGSPTFGQSFVQTLSSENHLYCYIPEGFAHGFEVISSVALVLYKVSDYHHPQHEHTLLWNDPELNIDWKTRSPQISEKDALTPFSFQELPKNLLLPFEGSFIF